MKRLAFLFFLFTLTALAQTPTGTFNPQVITFRGVPTGVCDNYQQALDVNTGLFYSCNPSTRQWVTASMPKSYTVATLPAPSSVQPGTVVAVTDAISPGSCTTGGGVGLALCRSNGTSWQPIGDGGGNVTSGSPPLTLGSLIGTSPCNPLTSQDALFLGCSGGKGPQASINGGALFNLAGAYFCASDTVQYVSFNGNNANNGCSPGTAKHDVYTAICSLPGGNCSTQTAGNGTVYIIANDSGVNLGTASNSGIWLMGSGDSQYATPPTGWLKYPVNGLKIECAPSGLDTSGYDSSTCRVNGGSSSDVHHPLIWISGIGGGLEISGMNVAGGVGRCANIGIDSTENLALAPGAVQIQIRKFNCGVQSGSGSGIGLGPAWLMNDNAYENTYEDLSIGGDFDEMATVSSVSRSSNVATVTTSGNHPFVNGEKGAIWGVTDTSFNCQSCVLTKIDNTHFSYPNVGPNASSSMGEALSDKAFAVDYFNGCMNITTWRNLFIQGDAGGFQLDANTCGYSNGTIDTVTSQNLFSPVVSTGFTPGPLIIKSITPSDPPICAPAVATGGGGVKVSGTFLTNGSCPQVSGGALVDSLYNSYVETLSPFAQQQSGVENNYLIGQTDVANRMGAPTAVRWANLFTSSPSGWTTTNFAGVNSLTTGLSDPYGGTNAAKATSTNSTNEALYFGYATGGNITYSTGDRIIVKAAFANGGGGTYNTSVNLGWAVSLVAAGSGKYSSTCYGGERGGQGEWQWHFCVIKILTGDTFATQIFGTFSSASSITAAYPVAVVIPASASISDNEAYQFAYDLTPYNSSCSVGTTCDIHGNVAGGVLGGTYPNPSLAQQGTGTAIDPAGPALGLYFGNNCPVSNTGQCYFTPANTQVASDCSWASSGATVTCATAHFVAGDVGKRVAGYSVTAGPSPTNGCIADRTSFSALTTTTAVTIMTFTDSQHVVLSSNPANTVASNGCFIWGTPDDTYASTFETAYAAIATYCPRIMLSSANYWFSSPHFYSQPTGCKPLPSLVAGADLSYGNLFLPQGVEVEGRGPGATQIYLGPDFPNGDSCLHASGGGDSGCFAIPVMGKWKDFGISGGGQSACQVPNNTNLLVVNVAAMENITLTNMCFGISGSTRVGIVMDQLAQLTMVNSSGWGEECLEAQNTGANQGIRVTCENSPEADLIVNGTVGTVGYDFQCFGCYFSGSATGWSAGSNRIQLNANSVLRLDGTFISPAPVPGYTNNSTTTSLIYNNGGKLYANNTFELVGLANGQSVVGLIDNSSSSVNYLFMSTLNSANSQPTYTFNAAGEGTLYDLGGNVFNLASGAFQPNNPISDGHSLSGSCTGTATSSSTLGLYGTGPNETTTTCTSTTLGSGAVMTQARTLSTLKVTATHTGVNASSGVVTVLKNGSTTTLTCTVGSTNLFCNDYTHTVSAVAGDRISIQFTTQGSEVLAGVNASVLWE